MRFVCLPKHTSHYIWWQSHHHHHLLCMPAFKCHRAGSAGWAGEGWPPKSPGEADRVHSTGIDLLSHNGRTLLCLSLSLSLPASSSPHTPSLSLSHWRDWRHARACRHFQTQARAFLFTFVSDMNIFLLGFGSFLVSKDEKNYE